MRFDLVNPCYKEYIRKDGTLLVRPEGEHIDMFSVLSSYAIKPGDIGQFKIKCVKPKGDSVGIISDTDIIKPSNSNQVSTTDTSIIQPSKNNSDSCQKTK